MINSKELRDEFNKIIETIKEEIINPNNNLVNKYCDSKFCMHDDCFYEYNNRPIYLVDDNDEILIESHRFEIPIVEFLVNLYNLKYYKLYKKIVKDLISKIIEYLKTFSITYGKIRNIEYIYYCDKIILLEFFYNRLNTLPKNDNHIIDNINDIKIKCNNIPNFLDETIKNYKFKEDIDSILEENNKKIFDYYNSDTLDTNDMNIEYNMDNLRNFFEKNFNKNLLNDNDYKDFQNWNRRKYYNELIIPFQEFMEKLFYIKLYKFYFNNNMLSIKNLMLYINDNNIHIYFLKSNKELRKINIHIDSYYDNSINLFLETKTSINCIKCKNSIDVFNITNNDNRYYLNCNKCHIKYTVLNMLFEKIKQNISIKMYKHPNLLNNNNINKIIIEEIIKANINI